jgi:hypothetical protein
MVIFRAVARLSKQTPSTDNVALCEQVAGISGADATPFVRVIRHKRGESVIRAADASPVLGAYLASMDALVRYLDKVAGRRS